MIQDTQYSNHYIADEGKVLWKDGAYGHEIWLGISDSIDYWIEISEEDTNVYDNTD